MGLKINKNNSALVIQKKQFLAFGVFLSISVFKKSQKDMIVKIKT